MGFLGEDGTVTAKLRKHRDWGKEEGLIRERRSKPLLRGPELYLTWGVLITLIICLLPGSWYSPANWPRGGFFGIFTWAGWFLSVSLGIAVALLGLDIFRIRGRAPSRAWWGSLGFFVLGLVNHAAAAGAGWMERHPAAALAGIAGACVLARFLMEVWTWASRKPRDRD